MIEDAIKILMDALAEKGIRNDCIVLVGGGDHAGETALAVGADGYCRDTAVARGAMVPMAGEQVLLAT